MWPTTILLTLPTMITMMTIQVTWKTAVWEPVQKNPWWSKDILVTLQLESAWQLPGSPEPLATIPNFVTYIVTRRCPSPSRSWWDAAKTLDTIRQVLRATPGQVANARKDLVTVIPSLQVNTKFKKKSIWVGIRMYTYEQNIIINTVLHNGHLRQRVEPLRAFLSFLNYPALLFFSERICSTKSSWWQESTSVEVLWSGWPSANRFKRRWRKHTQQITHQCRRLLQFWGSGTRIAGKLLSTNLKSKFIYYFNYFSSSSLWWCRLRQTVWRELVRLQLQMQLLLYRLHSKTS